MSTGSSTPQMRMGATEWTILLFLALVWGGSFFFVEVAIRELPPFTVVFLRVALGAVTLWAIVALSGASIPRGAGLWGSFFIMGLLNNALPFSLFAWGQTEVASGLASILNATTPMFTVMVASAALADERATPLKVAGVAVGFLGVVVMIGPSALTGEGSKLWAQLACLAAPVSYALAAAYGRRFARMGIAPTAAAAGQVTAAAVILLPIMLILDAPWTLAPPSVPVWGAVLGIAVLSTGIAYSLYFHILAKAGATNIALVTFLVPPVSILLGVFILSERLAPEHLAGMALIGVGLLLIDGRMTPNWVKPKDDQASRDNPAACNRSK